MESLILLLVDLALVLKSDDWLVNGVLCIAERYGIPPLVIGRINDRFFWDLIA